MSRYSLFDLQAIIPSPLEAFRKAACLMVDALEAYRGPTIDMTRSLKSFDIDATTGFIPSKPLPRLSGPYRQWEDALSFGLANIKLGEYIDEDDAKELTHGESWRHELYNEVTSAPKSVHWTPSTTFTQRQSVAHQGGVKGGDPSDEVEHREKEVI